MAPPTTDLAVYGTYGPDFDPGYQIVFIPPAPTAYVAPTSADPNLPPPYSDPRGVLPSSVVPSKTLSYEIYEEVKEFPTFINPNQAVLGQIGAAGILGGIGGAVIGTLIQAGLGQSLAGQVFARSQTMVSLIAFEGKDVIDLPTNDLVFDGTALVVPDNVFLPVYAGSNLFMPPMETETFATKAAREYRAKSPSNMVQQIRPSINPPLDSMTNPAAWWTNFRTAPNRFVDVGSNAIILNGSASYVSYVACSKPLFRDVVYLSSGAVGQGLIQPSNNLLLSFAGPWPADSTIVQVFRYAWVDINEGTGQPASYQWRLSESFGVIPANIEQTPPGAVGNDSSEIQKHYAYNTGDASPDIDNSTWPGKILKTGVSPAFAAIKMNESSPFYDRNFKTKIVPLASGQTFGQGRLQIKKVFGFTPGVTTTVTVGGQTIPNDFNTDYASNVLLTERVYQSPYFQLDMSRNGRLGLEYAVHEPANSHVFGADEVITLASTSPAVGGLGAFCIPSMRITICSFADNGIATYRAFDDSQILSMTIASSRLNAFLLAEILQESGGTALFCPSYRVDIGVSGTSGTATIPSGIIPVSISVSAPVAFSKPTILRTYAGSSPRGSPLFEVVLPAGTKGVEMEVPLPPIAFGSFDIENPSEASVLKISGTRTQFLEAVTTVAALSPATPNDAISDWQLKALPAETFPLKATGVSSAYSSKGTAFVACENGGRIDMGVKFSAIKFPYLPIRDICMRIPANFTTGMLNQKATGLPTASQPCLLLEQTMNKVLLFYHYKNRILVKGIPAEIFGQENAPQDGSQYVPEIEARLAKRIQRMVPYIAYDGNQDGTDLAIDISLGAVANIATATGPISPNTPGIRYFSACKTDCGMLLCFLQDNDKIIARRSGDGGLSWTDVFPPDTAFVPVSQGGSVPEAPSCFFFEHGYIALFVILENALLLFRLPQEMFLFSPAQAKAYLGKIPPEFIYGPLVQGSLPAALSNRGIIVPSAVIQRQESGKTESISPQRVSIVRSSTGVLRLFFADKDSRLQTLISADGGMSWQTEKQFIGNRKT